MKNYIFETSTPIKSIASKAVTDAVFIMSPMMPFAKTDKETDAASIIKNLYDNPDNKLDITSAKELVQLAAAAGYSDHDSFGVLYSGLEQVDRRNFESIVEQVMELGKKDVGVVTGQEENKPETNSKQQNTQQGKKNDESNSKKEPVKQAQQQPVKVTNPPTEQEFKEKFPEEYKVVSEAAQAANSIGFNINNFLKPNQQPVAQQVPVGQQSSMIQQQPIPVQQPAPVQAQQNTLPPKADPLPGASLQDRVAEMKKHYKLIDGTHPGMTADNINSLLFLLQNTQLKADMKKYDAKSRPNNMFMQEIEMPDEFKGKFDFCFKMTTKNPKKYIRVLLNSNQEFIAGANSWANATQFDIIEQEKKGGK